MFSWTEIAGLVVLAIAGMVCTSASAADFYVAINGNDAWSGRLPEANKKKTDGPFATVAKARDALRASKAKGEASGGRIIVRGGAYFLDSTLELTPEDSGLTIEAAPGEEPVLYGGRRVTDWKRDGEKFWAASLPEVVAHPSDARRRWDFRLLVVNGVVAKRARLPETGVFTHLTEFKVPWMSTTGGGWQRKPTPEELTTMKYQPADLGPWLDVANAELTVYHMWDESTVGLSSHDPLTQTLRFSTPAGHPPGAFGVQQFVVWNVREGMKKPGQWYLDRTAGKVVYWPLPGENMTKAEVIAPRVESVLHLKGTKESQVVNVTLKGLTLSVTNTPLVAGGFGASRFDGALSLAFVNQCRLRDLTVLNVAGQGIKGHGCTQVRIEGCELKNIGACGVKVDGTNTAITDNSIHHTGIAYPSAIALWIGGDHLEASHNEIHDAPYTGIAGEGNDHLIEGNLIHRVMQVLHDGAAIYITFCKGITVRGNVVREIADTGGYGASAYYLDEQAQGCLVERNLAEWVGWPSHNHMAKGNTIRGNVFLTKGDAKLTFPRSTDFALERNVIYATGKIVVHNPGAVKAFTDNIFFSEKGQVEGVPAEAIKTDPLFMNLAGGDYRFKSESPALRLGVQPIDVSAAGRHQ